ncbi:serine hydrolase domain-containing protein [Nocardia caishijiensis]|uniref:D-alanyl-D-alanine carboxypeptidase n=1 Tax=Nocardia caishijiensis TaxID=184756 RepID=A0ABQ6YV20_9NOCA|nr:serine hydrolase domain-containing protein [Nocardia caishijiensis]KAF0849639.1 D-alanyl-D-alanine carboxypeptidase [Nocardia caishijiensis]
MSNPKNIAEQDRPELQALIERIVDSGFVGASLRVHDRRGAWVGSAGVCELGATTPPPVDGHVRIGSNTKTFTAAVVLRLVAEGLIELDTPALRYLPDYALDERVTVRMLLQHTSGIFNITGEMYDDGTVVPGVPSTIAGKEWVDKRFETYRPEDLANLALAKPSRFEPGTGWSYSNTNYIIVRLLVERVTGHSLAEEARRLIFGPLGMTDTVLPGASTELPEPHPHAYYRYIDGGEQHIVDVTKHNPSWVCTGGDMISTTADLHTFVSALLDGTLLPQPLLAEMLRTHDTGIPGMPYGLGVFVQETESGATVITHNGGIAGYATLMYSTPDAGVTMTAYLTFVDDAEMTLAPAFQVAQKALVDAVFGGESGNPVADRAS